MAKVLSHSLPGIHQPVWMATAQGPPWPQLSATVSVDVAIIGGGFAGLMTAYLMKRAGLSVAVLESRQILSGVTGHTTAKVTSLHGLIYDHLLKAFGQEQARMYGEANQAAIEKIAGLIHDLDIYCDFVRRPSYTYAETEQALPTIEAEVKAAQKAGLPASFVDEVPIPRKSRGAVCFENQAQFHPVKFLIPIATQIPGNGSYLFEKSRAMHLEEGEPCRVKTDHGLVKARDVIIATNFPVLSTSGLYFARLYPKRSYVVGARVNQPFPNGMFQGADESQLSFRSTPTEEGEILIIGGGEHKTGHAGSTIACYRELIQHVKETYEKAEILYRWSTQDNVSADSVPYIGKMHPLSNHTYVATGFRQWGMTTSVVAAMVLTDIVRERQNPWSGLFDPGRFKGGSGAARRLWSENKDVAREFIGSRISRPKGQVEELGPDEAEVVDLQGERAAAYRDAGNELHVVDPTCTHLQCIVRWNNGERSWDCPCHGSRFNYDGEVIHGPAVKDLPRKRVDKHE